VNVAAVLVATVAVTVFSAAWYISLRGLGSSLGAPWAQRSRPPSWQVPLTLIRSFFVAAVVAWLVTSLGIADLVGAVGLALALWVAFPVILLVGSVTQENVPWRLAAIHAGDWLAKLVIIAVIVSLWR
jgi:Protein of unknown function (DUF1761)